MRQTALRVLVMCTIGAASPALAESPPERPSLVVSDVQFGSGGFPGTRTTTAYTYDERGNVLLEVQERDLLRDGHVDFRMTIASTYDARGNPLSRQLERDFTADSTVDETETTTWTYGRRGRLTARTTVSARSSSSFTTTTSTRFAYDARGNVVRETTDVFRDADPELDRQSTLDHTYNARGDRTSTRELVFDDLSSAPLAVAQFFAYDAHGNQTGRILGLDLQADGSVDSLSIRATLYTRLGLSSTETVLDDVNADGAVDLLQQTISVHDVRGNLQEEIRSADSGANGSIDHQVRRTLAYDASGRLLRTITVTDQSGNGLPDLTETTEYFY